MKHHNHNKLCHHTKLVRTFHWILFTSLNAFFNRSWFKLFSGWSRIIRQKEFIFFLNFVFIEEYEADILHIWKSNLTSLFKPLWFILPENPTKHNGFTCFFEFIHFFSSAPQPMMLTNPNGNYDKESVKLLWFEAWMVHSLSASLGFWCSPFWCTLLWL